ncbi:hypothetical protein A5CPEGH6_07370 [Alistipes dispar]|uniref:Uncharacterized protein n=1 Tax=Alistipes dispar TaxID=2585119 RepID=A0A4Y1X0T0_9BACT|nr:hypothetical protein A5CPEGH6_07370 [Alistipes dispar]
MGLPLRSGVPDPAQETPNTVHPANASRLKKRMFITFQLELTTLKYEKSATDPQIRGGKFAGARPRSLPPAVGHRPAAAQRLVKLHEG